MWRHTFKVAAVTLFHREVLPSGECTFSVCPAPAASAGRLLAISDFLKMWNELQLQWSCRYLQKHSSCQWLWEDDGYNEHGAIEGNQTDRSQSSLSTTLWWLMAVCPSQAVSKRANCSDVNHYNANVRLVCRMLFTRLQLHSYRSGRRTWTEN